jgi:hypothetical protein
VQKEAAKADRALQTTARCQHAQEEKACKLEEKAEKQAVRQALQDAKKAESEAKKAAKQAYRSISRPRKPVQSRKPKAIVDIDGSPQRSVKVVPAQATRTQVVITPERFCKKS